MSTLSQMGIPAAGFGMLQPKMSNKWQVTFTRFANLVASNAKDITRQAVTISRPSLAFDEVKMHRYNSTAYVAGKYEWEAIDLEIEDDITGLASTAIQAQLQTQQRLIGGDLPNAGNWLNSAASGSDYKFGMTIQMLDGNEGVLEEWKLEGCWIKTSNYGELNYENNEIVKIKLNIRFDHARQTLSGQGYGTALGGNV
jgi:hypothetical protein